MQTLLRISGIEKLKSDNSSAWYNLGRCYVDNERTDDDIAAFEQAVKYEPTHAEAWYSLGSCIGILLKIT